MFTVCHRASYWRIHSLIKDRAISSRIETWGYEVVDEPKLPLLGFSLTGDHGKCRFQWDIGFLPWRVGGDRMFQNFPARGKLGIVYACSVRCYFRYEVIILV